MLATSVGLLLKNTAYAKRFLSVHHFAPSPDAIEQITPIVFLCGEYLSTNTWLEYTKLLESRGYSGFIYESECKDDINGEIKNIENEISEHGMLPPCMVAHSTSGFLGLKFLESYALRGLAIVNPIPLITNSSDISRCLEITNIRDASQLNKYYDSTIDSKYISKFVGDKTMSSFIHPFTKLVSNMPHKDIYVNLERDACSIHLMISQNQGQGRVINEEDVKKYRTKFGSCQISRIPFETRLPMVGSTIQDFDDMIYPWINGF